ncbi:MAG: dihydrofolate reductase family protein [Nocardioides sp.]
MGSIVVSTNVTIDGVFDDPTGEEGSPAGGWFNRVEEPDLKAWSEHEEAEVQAARAMLLGANSYRWLAERWATREGTWADRLREIPKYVVSTTLQSPDWGPTSVLSGDLASEISNVKQNVDGEIVVYASGRLVETLWADGLVDELRLVVFPFLAGAGRRLPGPGAARLLPLVGGGRLSENLVRHVYAVAPRA